MIEQILPPAVPNQLRPSLLSLGSSFPEEIRDPSHLVLLTNPHQNSGLSGSHLDTSYHPPTRDWEQQVFP